MKSEQSDINKNSYAKKLPLFKGHFFSDHSAQTQKRNFHLFFSGFLPAFLDFLSKNYSIILEY